MDDLTYITYTYPNNVIHTLNKQEGKWYYDGMETDSTNTARYLSKISRLTSSSFIDEDTQFSTSPAFQVKLEGNNMLPVEIRAYPADSTHMFVMTSSRVPDTHYSGKKGGLFEKIFVDSSEFFARVEE